MDVKDAVRIATDYVLQLESVSNADANVESAASSLRSMHYSIEGTKFDESRDAWVIEVGFTRPWDKVSDGDPIAALSPLGSRRSTKDDLRTIKSVVVSDSDGRVIEYGN